MILGGNMLAFVGVEVVQVFGSKFAGAALVNHLVHDSNGRFCQNADGGNHDFVVVRIVFKSKECFVFPREQYIALAVFDECCRRATCARGENENVCVEFFHEILGLFLITVILVFCPSPSSEVVPACATRSFRVRCNDANTGFYEITPVLEIFRIALANQEHDGGGVGRAVEREFLDPTRFNEPCITNGVHVEFESERDNISFKAVCHFQSLFARTAMGLCDFYVLTGLFFPVLGKDLVVVGVKLTSRVVRYVGECLLFCGGCFVFVR